MHKRKGEEVSKGNGKHKMKRNGERRSKIKKKNKKEIFYWKALNGENLRDLLLKTNPQRVPYLPEIQGEAICFNVGATGFLTSTERANALEQPIFYFSKN